LNCLRKIDTLLCIWYLQEWAYKVVLCVWLCTLTSYLPPEST
jgi:hypothetical protein